MRDCEECGEEIESGRLKALPHTKFCIHCQRQQELQGKFPKHMMVQRDVYKNGGEIEESETKIVRGN